MKKLIFTGFLVAVLVFLVIDYYNVPVLAAGDSAVCTSGICSCTCKGTNCSCSGGNNSCFCTCLSGEEAKCGNQKDGPGDKTKVTDPGQTAGPT